jgi:hypothetical protein
VFSISNCSALALNKNGPTDTLRPQDLSFRDNIVTGLEMVLHLGGSPVLETVQDSEDITVKEEVDEKYIEVSTTRESNPVLPSGRMFGCITHN